MDTIYKDKRRTANEDNSQNKLGENNNAPLVTEGVKEGIKEKAKEEAKEKEVVKDKLDALIKKDEITLFRAKTFFPVDFFPDTIVIYPMKVSILSKQFFATEQLTIINIKDIADVTSERAIFFANLVITYVPKTENMNMRDTLTHTIRLLRPKEAARAQNILKCMLIIRREGVDISNLSQEELENAIKRFEESNSLTSN